MTLRILPSALEDLADGHDFYEAAEPGLGACFLEHLYSKLIRCDSTREFIQSVLDSIDS